MTMTGFSKIEVRIEVQRLRRRAHQNPSVCWRRHPPLGKGELTISLRRFHQLTSVALRRHRRATKGRRLDVQ